MEFGSSFVYLYDETEEEIISDDELDNGMCVSSESDSDDDSSKAKIRKHYWRNINSKDDIYCSTQPSVSGRNVRRADTNVVSIDFSKLATPSHTITGDPVYCKQCRAIMSYMSHISRTEDIQELKCEFCETLNHVNCADEEIPQHSDVTFMLEQAMEESTSSVSISSDESLIVFCIDISGSMADTLRVPGRRVFRGYKPSLSCKERKCEKHKEVTYISRLQAVQNAVEQQLDMLYKNHPKSKVAIVTFSDEVEVVGDQFINRCASGRTLEIWNDLRYIGTRLPMPGPIKDTKERLTKEIFKLRTLGSTALGPALLICTTFASQKPGSKVVICTDGEANEGLGSLDGSDIYKEGEFYDKVGKIASVKGVNISVISFRDTDCRLVHLGKLADKTAGKVNMVDFDKLQQEFSSIMSTNVIATNVGVTAILHKQVYVLNDDNQKENKVEKQIGNVTADSEITFEYRVRTRDDVSDVSLQDGDAGSLQTANTRVTSTERVLDEIPFQIQIRYTDRAGTTSLRVITRTKTTTRDRKIAEQNANVRVIGCNAQKQVADLALDGQFTDSRTKAMTNQRLLWRHKKTAAKEIDRIESKKLYKKICSKISRLECRILNRQKDERERRGRSYSRSLSRSRSRSRSRSPRPRSLSGRRSRSRSRSRGRTRLSKGKRRQAQRAKDMSDDFSVSLYKSKFCRTDNQERSRSRSFSPARYDSDSSALSYTDDSDVNDVSVTYSFNTSDSLSSSDSDSRTGSRRNQRRTSRNMRCSRSRSPYLNRHRRRSSSFQRWGRMNNRSRSPYLNRHRRRSLSLQWRGRRSSRSISPTVSKRQAKS